VEDEEERAKLLTKLPVIYTVRLNAGGGYGVPEFLMTNHDGSRKLSALPVPARTGHIFTGWFTEITGGERVTVETVFDSDTTIFARWEGSPDASEDIIIWASGPNNHIGLNLTRETLVQRTAGGEISDFDTAVIRTFQFVPLKKGVPNPPAAGKSLKWNSTKFIKGSTTDYNFALTLPRLINKGFQNLTISAAALVSKAMPENAELIVFPGLVNPRLKFGVSQTPAGEKAPKFAVNYSSGVNFGMDTWTLTARTPKGVAPEVNYGFIESLLISDEITKANKKAARAWAAFADLAAVNITGGSGAAGTFGIVDTGANAPYPKGNPFEIIGLDSSGKAQKSQFLVRENARANADGSYTPASQGQRVTISGYLRPMYAAGKEPKPKGLVLSLKKNYEILDGGNVFNAATENNAAVGAFIFSTDEKGITFVRPAGSQATTAADTITVRTAAVLGKPASVYNVIPVVLAAVE